MAKACPSSPSPLFSSQGVSSCPCHWGGLGPASPDSPCSCVSGAASPYPRALTLTALQFPSLCPPPCWPLRPGHFQGQEGDKGASAVSQAGGTGLVPEVARRQDKGGPPIPVVCPPPSPAAFLAWTPWGASESHPTVQFGPLLPCISFRMAPALQAWRSPSAPAERVLGDQA